MFFVKDTILSLNFEELFDKIKKFYYSDLDNDISYIEYHKLSASNTKDKYIEKVKQNYAKAWEYIKNIKPIYDKTKVIVFKKYLDTNEDDCDIYFYSKQDENKITYSLREVSWNELLGFSISDESINDYGEIEVATHILFDLTYHGYNPNN